MDSATSVAGKLYSRLADVPDAERKEQELIAKNVSAVAYVSFPAGADTTSSAVQSFFLAMLIFPEVQQKAREELDRVVGRDRLTNLDDRKSLPYVGQALIKEIMRWQLVFPLASRTATPPNLCTMAILFLRGQCFSEALNLGLFSTILRCTRTLVEGWGVESQPPTAASAFAQNLSRIKMRDNNIFLIVASVLSPSIEDGKHPHQI
ncbi:cytochrome P450 [Mycena metata]|uniref:Cytochrome P450 n=1 Tax=Mycena metata TaxID=1033252 RepID=A0AAD7HYH3_9AGAR|nr:cytochrome P450 [Mycena metata]